MPTKPFETPVDLLRALRDRMDAPGELPSDDEIDWILQGHKPNVALEEVERLRKHSVVGSMVEGVADIGGFQGGDEARGWLADKLDRYGGRIGTAPNPTGRRGAPIEQIDLNKPQPGREAQADLTDAYRQQTEDARTAHPAAFYGAGLLAGGASGAGTLRAGAALPVVGKGLVALRQASRAVTPLLRVGGTAGEGSILGALGGFGSGEGGVTDRLQPTLAGAALGATVPAAVTGLGIGAKAIIPGAAWGTEKLGSIGNWLGSKEVGGQGLGARTIGPIEERAMQALNQQLGETAGPVVPKAPGILAAMKRGVQGLVPGMKTRLGGLTGDEGTLGTLPGSAGKGATVGDILPDEMLGSDQMAITPRDIIANVAPQKRAGLDALRQLAERGAGRAKRLVGDTAKALGVSPHQPLVDTQAAAQALRAEGSAAANPLYTAELKGATPLPQHKIVSAAVDNPRIASEVDSIVGQSVDPVERFTSGNLQDVADSLAQKATAAKTELSDLVNTFRGRNAQFNATLGGSTLAKSTVRELKQHARTVKNELTALQKAQQQAQDAADFLGVADPLTQKTAQIRHWINSTRAGKALWGEVGGESGVAGELTPKALERMAQQINSQGFLTKHGFDPGDADLLKLRTMMQDAVDTSTSGGMKVPRELAREGYTRSDAFELGATRPQVGGPVLGEELSRLAQTGNKATGLPLAPGVDMEMQRGVAARLLPAIAADTSETGARALTTARSGARGMELHGLFPTMQGRGQKLVQQIGAEHTLARNERDLSALIRQPPKSPPFLARLTSAVAAQNPTGGIQHGIGWLAQRYMRMPQKVSDAYLKTLMRPSADRATLLRELAKVRNMGRIGDATRARMAEQYFAEYNKKNPSEGIQDFYDQVGINAPRLYDPVKAHYQKAERDKQRRNELEAKFGAGGRGLRVSPKP
jgi:hypothetical protein